MRRRREEEVTGVIHNAIEKARNDHQAAGRRARAAVIGEGRMIVIVDPDRVRAEKIAQALLATGEYDFVSFVRDAAEANRLLEEVSNITAVALDESLTDIVPTLNSDARDKVIFCHDGHVAEH